jgi:hypothetical protein
MGSTNGAGSTELKILGVGGLGPPNVKKNFFVFRGCCFGDSIVPIWTCCGKNFRFFWSAVLKLGRFKVTKPVLFGAMYGLCTSRLSQFWLDSRDILAMDSTNGAGSTELKILGVGGLGPPNAKKIFFVFRGCCFGDSIAPIWTCCRKNFRFFWSAVGLDETCDERLSNSRVPAGIITPDGV